MFNLLKGKTQEILKEQWPVALKTKPELSTKELVEEIHETFYTEVDRLLEMANKKESEKYENPELASKAKRLKELGFNSSKTVNLVSADEEMVEIIRRKNQQKQELIDTIQYFQMKYPNYKFITEESVKKICDKYGLIYGSVQHYTGDVPENNLVAIEKAKFNEKDLCYEYETTELIQRSPHDFRSRRVPVYVSHEEHKNKKQEKLTDDYYHADMFRMTVGIGMPSFDSRQTYKSPLEIAAPKSDFNLSNMDVEDSKIVNKSIEVPDPVVLQPVFRNGQKHYLIITAWGPEASDELVVNEKMN